MPKFGDNGLPISPLDTLPEIYTCEACGITGELNDLHHEEIDGVLTCMECNGGGELSTKEEIEAFEKMVEDKKKPFDFGDLNFDDL